MRDLNSARLTNWATMAVAASLILISTKLKLHWFRQSFFCQQLKNNGASQKYHFAFNSFAEQKTLTIEWEREKNVINEPTLSWKCIFKNNSSALKNVFLLLLHLQGRLQMVYFVFVFAFQDTHDERRGLRRRRSDRRDGRWQFVRWSGWRSPASRKWMALTAQKLFF